MSERQKISNLNEVPSIAAYLKRIGAEVRSMRTAVVKEIRGHYWKDLAIIRFNRDGEIKAPDEQAPTKEEAEAISEEMKLFSWPNLMPINNPGSDVPEEISRTSPENLFEFRDIDGKLLMLQIRREVEGGKVYVPWTFWDDNQWRRIEPEGHLPLWGLEQLGNSSTVFVHEGAKAARTVREMVAARTPAMRAKLAAHPWGRELSGAAHVGWIGGALSPARTDWSALVKAGIRRVYIVSDNDAPGIAAVPAISYALPIMAFHLQFTNEWPVSFDLADDFPKTMFEKFEGELRYVGPTFRQCLHPATWATDLKPVAGKNGKTKTSPVLRDSFKDLWAYVEEANLFVCKEMPDILRDEPVMNKMLAPFSHVAETSRLIVKSFRGRTTRLCYRPDIAGRVVTDRGSASINLHVPAEIRSLAGNPEPWLEFMEYLIPDEKERHETLKWCATIIAKPEVRMHYGLLLVTEKQGVGKTTLGSAIIGPLVGLHNVGWPSESDIANSQFNGWLANKRLVVVNEIYSGHSWKAYNALKSMITDTQIEVNQKYQRTYTVENWCHIIACSNSTNALKMEQDDRRWYYPLLTEILWPRQKFAEFRKWLSGGGLGVIKHWAENFGDYVASGDRAPMTARKGELIAGSRSEGMIEAIELAESMIEDQTPKGFAMKDIMNHLKNSTQGKLFENDLAVRKAMIKTGCFVFDERIHINGRSQWIIINPMAKKQLQKLEEAPASERVKTIRSMITPINNFFEPML
jgi:hypothetical protein